jgi:predicted outer membrane repeat protein
MEDGMKKLLAVIAVCLAVFGMFVTGCGDLWLDGSGGGGSGGGGGAGSGDLPEGYGAVSVRLTSGAERTAAPGNVLEKLHLSYVFTRFVEEDGTWVAEEPMAANEEKTVILKEGKYRLAVKAYADEARTELVAEGATEEDFEIIAGKGVTVSVFLRPKVNEGEGELAFDLTFPDNTKVETLTLTLMPGGEPIDYKTCLTINGTKASGTKSGIAAGYYLLQVVVVNEDKKGTAGRTEVVHVYKGQETKIEYVFEDGDFREFYVSSAADDGGPGTLRWAIENALALDKESVELLLEPGTVVELKEALKITKKLTIEGNGVILTRGKDWTTATSNPQLVYISGTDAEVVIRGVHFKDGNSMDAYGGAIYNEGKLTLESCIFSGNVGMDGGAVYSKDGDLTIRGCTFYGNSAQHNGGAVLCEGSGSLTLTGNLFYGNTATGSYPVVHKTGGTLTAMYNVVDVDFGIDDKQAGFANNTTDHNVKVDVLPVSPVSFKVLYDSNAKTALKELLDYPEKDFYGNEIKAVGAAGAVQGITKEGWYLGITVKGEGKVDPPASMDEDGVVLKNDAVIMPEPGPNKALGYWKVNGVKMGAKKAGSLEITKHSIVEAVFGREKLVSNEASLHSALETKEVQEDDVIVLSEGETITLNGPLPEINTNVVIEGNGVILTTDGWSPANDSQLLRITDANAEVLIRRVHFKDGNATNNGGAVYNEGKLILESCIFSGNRSVNPDPTNQVGVGGAVRSTNDLTIRGCTFYKNTAYINGGAVCINVGGKTLTLTGNVFSGNSAGSHSPVVYNSSENMIKASYNVVDNNLGRGAKGVAGWTTGEGKDDVIIDPWPEGLPISPVRFKPLKGNVAATNLPNPLPEGYPEEDFYGNPIEGGKAAGAVQETTARSGYYLELAVNNSSMGDLSGDASSDEDGIVTSLIGIQPTPKNGDYAVASWTMNGETMSGTDPQAMTTHTWATAVFGWKAAASVEGLKSVLADDATKAGDVIVVSGGDAPIELTSPLEITESVTIEGKGLILKRMAGWPSNGDGLLSIGTGAEVVIRGVLFTKEGSDPGKMGRAVDNAGKLTLESCIFDGNYVSGDIIGGAVWSSGDLTIRGCTFYNNKAEDGGRAVHFEGNSLTLTGNLFYYAISDNKGTPMVNPNVSVTSSYNVANKTFGTGNDQTGFAGGTGNTTLSALGISDPPFDATSFVPVSGLKNVILTKPVDFPATDFYGTVRTFPGAPGAVQ